MGHDNEFAHSQPHSASYSWQVGLVYIFNCLVSTGLLALPKAFVEVGCVLGLVGICFLAFMSYCTLTFVIETESIYNAFLRHKLKLENENIGVNTEGVSLDTIIIQNSNTVKEHNNDSLNDAGGMQSNVIDLNTSVEEISHDVKENIVENPDEYFFEITEKAELAELSKLFFHKIGVIFYYIAICLYLYGTESTYFAAMAKSMTSVVCGDSFCLEGNKTVRCNCFDGNVTEACSTIKGLSIIHTYQIMLAIFALLCTPFVFFDFTKTKWLQIFTMVFRWFAVIIMITLATIKIKTGEGSNTRHLVVFEKLPNFLGTTLFGFMCQYSIANVITPITNKKHLKVSLMFVYMFVVAIVSIVVITAMYAFEMNEVQDLYTLNFSHPLPFKYILELFPVFTLPLSIPIVAISLRENLKTLFLSRKEEEYGILIRRVIFPLLATIPSIIIAYSTYNVGMLVGYTGAYTGAIIQYVVPAILVYCARKKAIHWFGVHENIYRSPFHHPIWVYIVLIWYMICFVLVTFYNVAS